jgi:chromosome segregation ATPase
MNIFQEVFLNASPQSASLLSRRENATPNRSPCGTPKSQSSCGPSPRRRSSLAHPSKPSQYEESGGSSTPRAEHSAHFDTSTSVIEEGSARFGFRSPSAQRSKPIEEKDSELQAKIDSVTERTIETRCAIDQIEERNTQLMSENARLEELVAQAQAQISEKNEQLADLRSGFEKRQAERNAFWSAQTSEIQHKIASTKSKMVKH